MLGLERKYYLRGDNVSNHDPWTCSTCGEELTIGPHECKGRKAMTANERQVGGNHYQTVPGEQHWDRQWRLYGRGYFIGTITAYVERYYLKNGLQDLEKALHFTQKLKELEEAWMNGTGPPPGGGDLAAPLQGYAYRGVVTSKAELIEATEPKSVSPDIERLYACPKCKGLGTTGFDDSPCLTCGGSGRVYNG